ncbi:MAG: EAL domain-containing protein [Myxococcota bacterium]
MLEVTERASLDGVPRLMERLAALRALGFDLAVDDLGAGYAGLSSFTQLDPRVAKLDMGLIRDIDRLPKKQSVVRAMRELCDELGVMVIARASRRRTSATRWRRSAATTCRATSSRGRRAASRRRSIPTTWSPRSARPAGRPGRRRGQGRT